MNAQLPGDGYHMELDNGEDVLLREKGGVADYNLILAGNSIKCARIHLDGRVKTIQ